MLEISRSELSTKGVTLVANTVTPVALLNVRRISLLVMNNGATDAFISERDTVAATGDLIGVPLAANRATTFGLSAVIGMDGKKRIYDGVLYVISTGTPQIIVSEESEID